VDGRGMCYSGGYELDPGFVRTDVCTRGGDVAARGECGVVWGVGWVWAFAVAGVCAAAGDRGAGAGGVAGNCVGGGVRVTEYGGDVCGVVDVAAGDHQDTSGGGGAGGGGCGGAAGGDGFTDVRVSSLGTFAVDLSVGAQHASSL